MNGSFVSDLRLMRGPWQAFERDVARLLLGAGFDDVRIVGGTGDVPDVDLIVFMRATHIPIGAP